MAEQNSLDKFRSKEVEERFQELISGIVNEEFEYSAGSPTSGMQQRRHRVPDPLYQKRLGTESADAGAWRSSIRYDGYCYGNEHHGQKRKTGNDSGA